jgi:dTDP-glucose 4,6-dehydratase
MQRAIALVRSDSEAVLAGRVGALDALRGTQLFISGGTGFLGAWLLELISVLNGQHGFGMGVTVFSRNARSFAARWPHLGRQGWARFQDGDIRYLDELPRETQYVIHAAALTDRRLFASQPGAVAETNSLGAQRILRAANLLDDLQKFVLISSGLVYGAQPWETPGVDEEHFGALRCDDVNQVYAESKRFAEVTAHCAISESKLPVVVARPFAFVGPYLSLQLPWAVTDFVRDSLNGGPLRIMGDGTTVRSLMYASDFAFWMLATLVHGRPRQSYNIGSPEPIDLAALARLITGYFSPVPEILTRVGQTGHERNRLVPSVDRAVKELGVAVTVPLNEAIQRTIAWHRFQQAL